MGNKTQCFNLPQPLGEVRNGAQRGRSTGLAGGNGLTASREIGSWDSCATTTEARSSVEEHLPDTEGVGGSNPPVPTSVAAIG